MSAISNYLKEALLDEVFRGTDFTPPSSIYLALYTSDPTDADSGDEVSATNYSRQSISFTSPSQVDGKAQIENDADIEFAVADENWGTITHFGLRDAETGGNLLYHGELTSSKTIESGDQFKVFAGDLKIELA